MVLNVSFDPQNLSMVNSYNMGECLEQVLLAITL